MRKIASALLQFDPQRNALGKDKEIRHGLSVALQAGRDLWLANDETITLERLSLQGGRLEGMVHFADHRQFALHDLLQLPVPPADGEEVEEADVEGVDIANGYLWLVGSHSFKRSKPKQGDAAKKGLKRLATVSSDGNRFLLARIPVVNEAGHSTLVKQVIGSNGTRTAAMLRGDDKGNELTSALTQDPHFQAFLGVPGKDNGFDIEGLAAVDERVLLGLRGPVLRGWACVLEVLPGAIDGDQAQLTLRPIGPELEPYRKHFLPLDGLGIRDLCVQGNDLLILAGPTMDLDGPVTLYRWCGGASAGGDGLVPRESLQVLGAIPFGRGDDHAEGICLIEVDGTATAALLVAYDSASPERLAHGKAAVTADIFALP